MTNLVDLPAIGPVIASHLVRAGIVDAQTLRSIGAREAFDRIRERSCADACLSMLTSLEAAVRGVPKRELAPEVKADLARFYREETSGAAESASSV